jgi:2-methylisocitrate lyase-like PEP mutase family enzyme
MTGTLAERRKGFRARMARRDAMILPGAGNALTARVIADQGFDAIYVTGAGISNTYLGAPDIGLVTLTELAGTVSAIAEITDLPLVVDIDTGFGNAINAQRTVRMIERAGAGISQAKPSFRWQRRCQRSKQQWMRATIPIR